MIPGVIRIGRGDTGFGALSAPSLDLNQRFKPAANHVDRQQVIGSGGVIVQKNAVLVGAVLVAALGLGFFLRARSDRGGSDIPFGRVDRSSGALVESAGVEPTGAEATPKWPPPVDLTNVDLDRDLHGVVVDEAGAPIPGVLLTFVRYPWRRGNLLNMEQSAEVELGPETVSSVDGTFRLRLRRGALGALRAAVDGYALFEFGSRQAGEHIRCVLTRGVTLRVRTFDEQRRPVARSRVTLRAGSPNVMNTPAMTDESGTAVFNALPHGLRVWVRVVPESLGNPNMQQYEVPRGVESDDIEITLLAGRTLNGVVTDAQTGAPIAGASIGMGWWGERPATTNVSGHYELRAWTGNGTEDISIEARGYGRESVVVGAQETINIKMSPGGGVRGRVVSPDGNPIAGVRVAAIGWEDYLQRRGSHGYAVTARDGTFELRSLRLDIPHLLTLMRDGLARTTFSIRPVLPFYEAGDIELAPGRAIEGVVLDGAGKPMPRAETTLEDRRPGMKSRYGTQEKRYTDHLGRFRFPDQRPGRFRLKAKVPTAGSVETLVELKPGRDRLGVELRFQEGRSFIVRVEDENGGPVVAVVGVRHRGGMGQATTDEHGVARFTVEGAVTLVTSPWVRDENAPPYVQAEMVMNVPDTQDEVVFVLQQGERIRGVVIGPDQKPFAGALVELVYGKGDKGTKSAGNDGRFEFTVPRGQTVDLVFRGLSNRRAPAANADLLEGKLVGVRAGSGEHRLELRMPRMDRALTVRVLDPEGRPVKGAMVQTQPGAARLTTDEDGSVKLTELPARELKLFASHFRERKRWFAPVPRTVVPNGQTITLQMRRAVAIRGVLRYPDKTPVAGAMLLGRSGDMHFNTLSDREGRFTLYGPEGVNPIEVRAMKQLEDGSGAQMPAKQCDVTTELELEFPR